jgi:hypothetical protein
MKARVALVAIVVVLALLVGSVAPRRAYAMEETVKYGLITSGVIVGVALIAIIGTALTRDDPRFLTEASPGLTGRPLAAQERIHVGSRCPQAGAAALVVCW